MNQPFFIRIPKVRIRLLAALDCLLKLRVIFLAFLTLLCVKFGVLVQVDNLDFCFFFMNGTQL